MESLTILIVIDRANDLVKNMNFMILQVLC